MDSFSVVHHSTLGGGDTDKFIVRWNEDDSQLACGCSDGTVKLYASSSGNLVKTLNCRASGDHIAVTSLRWRPAAATRNVLLATTADGGLHHWHAGSGKFIHSEHLPGNQVYCSDYAASGEYFVVGCRDMSARIYDESTKSLVQELSPGLGDRAGHSNRVFCVKWVDEHLLLSGGWDNNVFVWDRRVRGAVRGIYGPHLGGDALDYSRGRVLTGSFSKKDQLQLWDFESTMNIWTTGLNREGSSCLVYAAQFSKVDGGGVFAVGGTGCEDVLFYDAERLHQSTVAPEVSDGVFSLDFANTSMKVAVGCTGGTVKIFELTVPTVL